MTADLVRQILAAIDELESAALTVRDAPADLTVITRPGVPQPTDLEKLALKNRLDREDRERRRRADPVRALLEEQGHWDIVLRRCAADRSLVELHRHEEMRFEAIARITSVPAEEVPYLACVECGERFEGDLVFSSKTHCATVRLLAEGYGITEETA